MNEKLQVTLEVTNPLYVPQVWLLTVGEYDDYHVLGVVIGDEEKARERAIDLSLQRAEAGEPSDLITVDFEKAEVL
jgi:hypothetical protein